eukprot:CAMPEP_0198726852 /NCGR_PEP_ID=MMETSP1475-20131203/3774_1 /TAXON_ID= ORGANISM="Unidentified sp., Strain CCMP1999" /NCGR_SAMPLE_ID=MMETSP1475 /ASSEMBLY_ACC=CAM_ASM_001111 /LENGTH=471 /DNA_ID=CAMNT_0044488825 /DNA_START=34 /DNA_END=1449 /DNA_ORIENTATION=-
MATEAAVKETKDGGKLDVKKADVKQELQEARPGKEGADGKKEEKSANGEEGGAAKGAENGGPAAGPAAGAAANKKKSAKKSKKKKANKEDGDVSSGEEYSDNLMENYIGQVGALVALGLKSEDVLNMKSWMELLDDDERNSLRGYLPTNNHDEQNEAAKEFLTGGLQFFGDLRQNAWDYILAGMTHPRIRRWKQRLILLQRRRYVHSMRDYHDNFVRSVLVRKRPRVGGLGDAKTSSKQLDASRPIIASGNDYMEGWDEERIKRVIDYRKQESLRYSVPSKAFIYHNAWGDSVVAPLKRGPAIDGGRPREHPLLKNERPSHVTILCLVRDGASRLKNNEGNRQEICDLLVDSQYIREGATMAQLNQVVSGALDRLHYEDDACVRYDPDTKHWCYLHNSRNVNDFETPNWAKDGKRSDVRKKRAAETAGNILNDDLINKTDIPREELEALENDNKRQKLEIEQEESSSARPK